MTIPEPLAHEAPDTSNASNRKPRSGMTLREAKIALLECEERYRMILDGIEDHAIFTMNPQGDIMTWNDAAERVKGYTTQQAIGKNFSCFFPSEDIERGRPQEVLRLTAENGRHHEKSMRVRRDGSRFLASLTFKALRNSDGTLLGFSEFSHDLGESKTQAEWYRGLLEAGPDALVVISEAGRIVLVNAQAEKQFGYTREELIGRKVKDIIPEGFAERLFADSVQSPAVALALEPRAALELNGERKNGTQFPVEITLSPLASAEGTLVSAAIRDTSFRKAAERDLIQMEARYRGLLEAAPDALVVVNPSGQIVLLNVHGEKQFGYSRDELIGQQVGTIIPEGEKLISDHLQPADGTVAKRIGAGIELLGRCKDGTDFPIEITLSSPAEDDGLLITVAIRDISVRKAAEKKLVQMEARYRGVLEAAPDAMVVVNCGGEIVLLNIQAEKQFGYSRDEMLGLKMRAIIPKGFEERLMSDSLRSPEDASAQQMGTGIELIGSRKDGSEFPIELILNPLESGEGTMVTAAIRDITERKSAEAFRLSKVAELNRLNTELAEANKDLESFTYSISHDLRSPLRHIDGFSKLLLEQAASGLSETSRSYLQDIRESTVHMGQLVDDLLALAFLGRKELAVQVTGLQSVAEDVVTELKAANPSRVIEWKIGKLPFVECDPGLVKQVFVNLLSNAVKFTRPRELAVIEIGITSEKGQPAIFVADNGVGFNMKNATRLFGVFQRLHRPEDFEGTGVGLATVQRIIGKHGGEVWADAAVDGGAKFLFTLEPRSKLTADPSSSTEGTK